MAYVSPYVLRVTMWGMLWNHTWNQTQDCWIPLGNITTTLGNITIKAAICRNVTDRTVTNVTGECVDSERQTDTVH